MGKKLLSIFFLLSFFFLSSFSGFGQCPTSVSISASPGTTICAGTVVVFTANVQDDTAYNYKWYVGTSEVGTDTYTFSSSTLSNGAKVKVIVTSADETNNCSTTSNELTMTVNAVRTPTVSVSSSKTSICPGESVSFTASNTNGGANPEYAFYLNEQPSALQSGTSNVYTTTSLTDGDRIRVVLTSKLECITSDPVVAYSGYLTVKAGTPAVPGPIGTSVGTEICPGTSQTYSISAVTGATSYQWTIPSGWSGSSTSNSINVTAGTSNGTISVKAINDCGSSEAQSLAITIKAGTPAVPGTITGTASVCPGVAETYTVAAVSGATEYIWSLPSGWTGTSTTNSISVTTGASSTGNISVQAKNDCGTSAAKTLAVSVKPGTPATPGTISGTAAVCPGVSQIYSISAVTGATSYIWTLPNGWTGTSTTNSITATSGTTGGNITVKATNDCGTSTEQTLDVTVKSGTPATPGLVSGSNLVCPGTSETYSVSPVNGATEYIWTLPSGWTGTSSSETIIVTTAQSGTGNITVKAKNDCGTSTAATIAVSVDKPAPVMSGSVTGPLEVCSTATELVYSIPAITNATTYTWSLPTGWAITAGEGTRSITVKATSAGGNISVIAKNTCGESAASANLVVNSVTGVPNTPGTVTAPNLPTNAICPPATGIEFNVPAVTGAKSYLWTLPTGWEITSGSGTNAIIVKVNSTAATTANASVSVEAINICGNSAKSTLSGIAIDNHVVTNAGADQTVCKIIAPISIEGNYSFSGTNANLKTLWTAPAEMGSFGSASKLATTYTPSQAALDAGSVILTLTTDAPSGACGPGKDDIKITFKPLPTATISATSPVCSGNTSTLTFTGTPNSRVTYKLNSGSNLTVDIPASGTINVTTPVLTANSTYSLVSSINLDTPACSKTLTGSATITVTPNPTAAITYTGTPFCTSLTTDQIPTLTGTNGYTGGIYSSTTGLTIDGSTGAITPSTSTPGTYTVTYKTPDAGGCAPVTATTQITITKAPTAAISYTGTPFCTSDSTAKVVTLTGTDGFSGGTFSAPAGLTINSSTGAITPSSSTAGTYIVTYNTPATGGCSSVAVTTQVTITKVPTVTISYPQAPFCLSDTSLKSVTITGTDSYTGGTYSAPSGLSINSSTGEINPSTSTVGTYTITYTSPATSGCGEVIATASVTITQTPAAVISYAGPYCNNDEALKAVTFTNTAGTYTGGTFSATTNGLSINTTTGEINPKTSSPGEYTVVYTIPAGGGCPASESSTKVVITQSPSVDINYTTPLCSSDTAAYSVSYTNGTGAFQGGTFTGTSGLSIDANGNIIPGNSTPGIHTVTYTTIAAEGCGSFQTTTAVEILQKVVITTEPVNVGKCSTESASFEVVASGDNLTYQWKRTDGAAITNATGVNSSKLSFSNATAVNAGEYFVEVSGSSPCTMAVSETVTLNIDENIVIIKPTEDLTFCDQERADVTFEFIAHAKGAPLTFTWIKDGVDIPNTNTERFTFNVTGPAGDNGEYSGTFKVLSPNPSDNGVYAVRIKGPDYFTCSDAVSKTFTLNVTPLPEPPTTEPVVLCQGQTAAPLTATGESGATFTWYDSQMIPINGVPTPSTSESGTITYYVTQTTEICKSNPSELKVTVKPTPAAPTTSQIVNYCYNDEVTTPLSATGANSSSTLNWYGPDDKNIALTLAPTPATTTTGIVKYWVSETFEGCESPLVEIIVTVNPLPEIIATADATVICEGNSTILHASGGTSYDWFNGANKLGTGADITVSPVVTTTYTVIGTNGNNCKNSTEITIDVDEPTVIGTLEAPTSVCANIPNGTLTLSGYTGDIIKWETKPATGTTWTVVNGNTNSTIDFTGLTVNTDYRVTVKNGVCAEATAETRIIIDPLPVGGELNFAGNGRVFTICENPVGNYAVDLNLTGIVGEVVRWGYRAWDATGYTTLNIGGEVFTGSTLTAAQIQALNFSKTTVFQVEVRSGVCSPDALSRTAILSVIPSDITPSPVTVDPGVVCLGEEVTLSSETGYESGGTFLDQGAFDNASITNHGWRIRREGISGDLGFDTDANNTEFDRWKRATPRAFTTASINSPYNTSGVVFDTGIEDGNKGFALISGNYRSTMETPVFTIGSTDQAILTFDQAYVLTPGASLKVEISTDGGNTYTTLYIREVPATATKGIASGNTSSFGTGTIDSHPENKISIDLGDYMGRPNLRIRFNYSGKRSGDIWAVDNIDIPEGPNGIIMEWRDYTDSTNPEGILIGTSNTEKWSPTQIGLNIFEVKTKLVYNSNGDACETAENAQRVEVFVFDQYTTTASANPGSCGNNTAQLSATVTNATGNAFTTFPTPDGYIGEWKIESTTGYTLVDSNPDDGIAAINDPNAILSANEVGTFKASFILKPTFKNAAGVIYENKNCLPTAATHDIVFQPCTTLDFDGVDDFVDLGEGYTGDYSIEAWIRPEAATGTIISTPNLEVNMGDLPGVTPNNRWYHIAVDSDGKLYIDGIATGTTISKTGSARAFIGARWNSPNPENYFSGWIEEVRIWNGKISEKNIRFTMNQRLKADGNIGVVVDMAHPDAPAFASLAGYYQLIATNILNGGYTLDLAANAVNGKLRNMTTTQENTAPLPFYTGSDGSWDTAATWARPAVWYIPNTSGITWNIVRTSHNVNANRGISVLGLVSEVNTLTMEGVNPTGWQSGAGGAGNPLTISHYLKLDGGIDLAGESQLLQPELSIVAPESSGWLERDQQGTANSYNYNYWSSPVSSAAGNVPYTIKGVMKDGSNSINGIPVDLGFGTPHTHADGPLANPRKISSYWLNLFHGDENVYAQWKKITETTAIPVGEGYTMKGTANVPITDSQNYTFRGIPNNGNINLSIAAEQSYMIGNPYPSAIEANEFILDNLKDVPNGRNTVNSFNGTLYFWSHFAGGNTHILKEYVGGYAVYNLAGGIRAFANDERINNTGAQGGEVPQEFIPVGQSFFINSTSVAAYSQSTTSNNPPTIHGGPVVFKNRQRTDFVPEGSHSVFHRPEVVSKEPKDHTDKRPKMWVKFKSPKGYHREILVAADENTTDGFDLGYDAPMIEYNVEDMFWLIGATELVIQGVPDFNKTRVIPMGLVIDGTEAFTIEIVKSQNLPENTDVYLKDKLTDSIHDLRKTAYVSNSEPGYINERFEIVFVKEDPKIEPTPEVPGEDIDYGVDISFRHAHVGRELQILNPKEVPINELLLFDMNGKLITTYKNISHEKEVRLPVKNYSAGVYISKLYSENIVITKKIIIQN